MPIVCVCLTYLTPWGLLDISGQQRLPNTRTNRPERTRHIEPYLDAKQQQPRLPFIPFPLLLHVHRSFSPCSSFLPLLFTLPTSLVSLCSRVLFISPPALSCFPFPFSPTSSKNTVPKTTRHYKLQTTDYKPQAPAPSLLVSLSIIVLPLQHSKYLVSSAAFGHAASPSCPPLSLTPRPQGICISKTASVYPDCSFYTHPLLHRSLSSCTLDMPATLSLHTVSFF